MNCTAMRELLPAYAEDRYANLTVRRHLSRCPDCRAELEKYQALRLGLGEMRSFEAEPPPDLVAKLQAIPRDAAAVDRVRTHVVRNRRAYAGGLAVAVVGATAAGLWRSRRSRLAPA